MADISKFQVVIGADIDGLQKSLGKVSSSLSSFGKKATTMGKNLSLGLTAPILALGAVAVKNFNKQAQAIGQVETAIASTGMAAGRTSAQLQKTASELQSITTFGDEEILQGVTAQLLTFTNIASTQFDRTQKAALDLSTRLGVDLKSSSIQLGKALNDPIANLSALSRSGIQFSDEQKEVIKQLASTNKLAEAQTIILDELDKQYGGSAEAAAKLGAGPLIQLQNEFGDLLEEVGGVILDGIKPLIASLKNAVRFFASLSGGAKKAIVVIAGIAAAIGPVVAIIGALSTAVAFIISPVGLVIAALAAVAAAALYIVDNWKVLKHAFMDIGWWKNAIISMVQFLVENNPIALLLKGINLALDYFGKETIPNPFEGVSDGLEALKTETIDYQSQLGSFGDAIGNAMSGVADLFSGGGGGGPQSADSVDTRKSQTNLVTNQSVSQGLGNTEGVQTPSIFGTAIEDAKVDLDSLNQKMESVMADINAEFQIFKEAATIVGNSVGNAFAKLGHNIVDSMGEGETGLGRFARSFASAAVEIIANALSVSVANAILAASGAAAGTGPLAPVTLPLFIASMSAAVIGAFASIPRFETGGFIGGNSMSGDKVMARVNTGEAVLNAGQQRNFMDLANGVGMGGEVQFRIQGADLIGSIDRETKRRNAAL
jgi:hypothetical protein